VGGSGASVLTALLRGGIDRFEKSGFVERFA
jgi:hypothetical protein